MVERGEEFRFPLEPPQVCSVFHGLRVGPYASVSVTGSVPNSGLLDRPSVTSPAARHLETRVVSWADTGCAARSATLPLVST